MGIVPSCHPEAGQVCCSVGGQPPTASWAPHTCHPVAGRAGHFLASHPSSGPPSSGPRAGRSLSDVPSCRGLGYPKGLWPCTWERQAWGAGTGFMGIQEQGDGGSLHNLPEGTHPGPGAAEGLLPVGWCWPALGGVHRHSAKLSGMPGPPAQPTPSTSPQLCSGHAAGHAAPWWQRGRGAACGAGRRLGVAQDLHRARGGGCPAGQVRASE